MSSIGSSAMAAGFTVMLLSVSAGMHFGGFGLFLCFMGVLVGANLVAIAVRMNDGPAEIAPVVFRYMCHNAAAVGLVMASCAFTAVSGEEDPALCVGMFALLLLGLILVNIGARAW